MASVSRASSTFRWTTNKCIIPSNRGLNQYQYGIGKRTILGRLSRWFIVKIVARFAPYLKVSPTKIGIALTELGYEQVRTKKGRFWKVAERPANEIDSRLPDDVPEPMPF